MKLFCAMVGMAVGIIEVDIDNNAYVTALRDAIATKNEEIKKSALRLKLFLAKKGNAWLTDTEAAGVGGDLESLGFKLMKSVRLLKNPEYFGEDFQTGEGHVHVLVVVPEENMTVGEPVVDVDGVNIYVTSNMTLNPPDLVAFWRAFQAIDTKIEADSVIALPEGTFILGNPKVGSRIYIRPCYPQLWEVCWHIIHHETPNLVILGNPGIGKTYFGYLLLLFLARLGKTVVYESRRTKRRFLFSRNVVIKGSQQDFDDILEQDTTYYVVDAMEPREFQARTILVTSPDRDVWYTFNKISCQTRYMPVWTEQEIFSCREQVYSTIPKSVVQKCFYRWGGIPRYVLQYAQFDNHQALIEKALEVVDFDWLMNAYGKLDDNNSQAHRLLHYRVNERFTCDYFGFASSFVQHEVYQHLHKKEKRKLLEFIGRSVGSGDLSVLRDRLAEEHDHHCARTHKKLKRF
eukprot:jgi/Phyca11/106457/e_gw1.12.537.1